MFQVFNKTNIVFESYNSTKPDNFVNSEGIFPVKFFPDKILPKHNESINTLTGLV